MYKYAKILYIKNIPTLPTYVRIFLFYFARFFLKRFTLYLDVEHYKNIRALFTVHTSVRISIFYKKLPKYQLNTFMKN
jgi:hypothetical protein